MSEKKKTHEDLVLSEGEIMRISIKKSDLEECGYKVEFACDGDSNAMVSGLLQICEEHFGLICIHKDAAIGIISISED